MSLLWAIFAIVVMACTYAGYRFGRWRERVSRGL